MRKMLLLFSITLCFTILFSGCAPSYQDVRNQIKPGMTYQEIVDIMGNEGEKVEGTESSYQWYIEDFVQIIMDFTEQDSAADPNRMILYQYEVKPGCSFIKKGMRYEQVVRLLGPPYKAKGCWKIHDTLFIITMLSPTESDPWYSYNIDDWFVNEVIFDTKDRMLVGDPG